MSTWSRVPLSRLNIPVPRCYPTAVTNPSQKSKLHSGVKIHVPAFRFFMCCFWPTDWYCWQQVSTRTKTGTTGDQNVKPVLEWMERRGHRPPWEEIVPHKFNDNMRVYCAQWQSLQLFNGVLYSLWKTPSGDATVKQLILPKSLRSEVLQQLHDTQTAWHLGVAKTLSHVRERLNWVQCWRDVQEWCRNCDLCGQKWGP